LDYLTTHQAYHQYGVGSFPAL